MSSNVSSISQLLFSLVLQSLIHQYSGSINVQRILPSKNKAYLFKDDTVIEVACTITSDKEIKDHTWKYEGIAGANREELRNNTGNVTIRNEWKSGRTELRSVLRVVNIPSQSDTFYYNCETDSENRFIVFHHIQEKNIPQIDVTSSIISNTSVVSPNKTIEGLYDSVAEIKCGLTFDVRSEMAGEIIHVRLTNSRADLSDEYVEYTQAKGVPLQYNKTNLEVNDGGVYTCTSEMKIEERVFTSAQFIKLTFPLRLTGDKEKKLLSSPFQDVELICDIEAFPKPSWTFYFQHSEILQDFSDNSTDNILHIRNVQKGKDDGVYSCRAEDETGRHLTQTINLIIVNGSKRNGIRDLLLSMMFTTIMLMVASI